MLYDGIGNLISFEDNILNTISSKYNHNINSINHRGYNSVAPENTLPAYILSKQKGFPMVECDVAFTSDGVSVLLHDSTIDRTSNGSGNIAAMTYAEASQYDYGSWKNEVYSGTKLPTFKEFIELCKDLGLHPYIELKTDNSYTQEKIESVVAAVEAAGMKNKVTYISFSASYLRIVKDADNTARLGLTCADITDAIMNEIETLKGDYNKVFINVNYANATEDKIARCIDADVPLEVWGVTSANWVQSMNPYISGVTADSVIAENVLYSKHIV